MRILISNDDGVYSPGLYALAEVAREFGEVKFSLRTSIGHLPDMP